jgi:fibronectin type 3 domain-containing protein
VGRFFLIVVAGVLALNGALLGAAVLIAVFDRRRRRRDIRRLEVLWQLEPARSTSRLALAEHPWTTSVGVPVRSAGRRAVGLLLVGALAVAGTASASPRARQAVASVFTSVSTTLGLGQDEQDRADGATVTRSDGSALGGPVRGVPDAASPDAGGTGISTSTGAPDDADGSAIVDPGAGPLDATTVTAQAISSSAVQVSWVDVEGESGYRVERSSDGAAGWIAIAGPAQNDTAYVDGGLASGTTYFYRVVATTDGGDASVSAPAPATTGIDPPSPPELSATTVSATQVDLGWTDVATETGYRIERSPDGETGWTTIGSTDQDVSTFTDDQLAPGTTYYYRVIATNASGDSAPSSVAMATTNGGPSTEPGSDTVPADGTTPTEEPASTS